MRASTAICATTTLCVLLTACAEPAADSAPSQERTVIDVTAVYDATSDRHLFQVSSDTIPAGWTTIRFTNASPVVHFVFFDHLPGQRTSKELLSEVSVIFQEAMNLIIEGKPDEANARFASLPAWFNDMVFRGGPGLTSPGLTTETTLYLEPGNYVMECYVKTADGNFHWNRGMFQDLHVTDEVTDAAPPPDPTLQVTVTDSALVIEGEPTPGPHLVAVHFAEKEPGFLGKDVHVARMTPGSSLDELVDWMDVNRPEGMVSTPEAPAPATFLGGVHEMPLGNTAYFTVTLEPGDYLWISEQPVEGATYTRFSVPPSDS